MVQSLWKRGNRPEIASLCALEHAYEHRRLWATDQAVAWAQP